MPKSWIQTLGNAPSLTGILLLCVTLEGCSLLGIRTTDEARYTIEEKDKNIEVRRYEQVMTIETYVEEPNFRDAADLAFSRLFDYISGSNMSSNDIAMTAPVLAEPSTKNGVNVAMTSPVIVSPSQNERRGWTLKFVLPASFTPETAPQPNDPLVKLEQAPEKLVAAISYAGLWSENNYQEKASQLKSWLLSHHYTSISLPSFAGYDPPWALPFLRRNEVLIDVQP